MDTEGYREDILMMRCVSEMNRMSESFFVEFPVTAHDFKIVSRLECKELSRYVSFVQIS